MRYDRGAIDVPSFARLGEEITAEIVAASAALPGLVPSPPQSIELAPDDHFVALRHDLSDHYLALNGPPASEQRSPAEAEALLWLEAESGGLSNADPHGFRESLGKLNQRLIGNNSVWRDSPIRLGGDRTGNRVYFPPVSAVPGQLEKTRLVLAGIADPPLFKAAVAYVLLLNCHPFRDGNGRTARALFNHALRQSGMPRNVYLPLYEIGNRSLGGYEIALRMAELRGDWASFLRYLLDAIQCCRRLAA